MGFGNFLTKAMIPGYKEYEVLKDIKENGLVDGIKKNHRRTIQEDNPLTSHIYQSGKHDGKKQGYIQASKEYEKKLLQQADEFLKQKNLFAQQRDEYEKLLDQYEVEIAKLEQKQARTKAENRYLQDLLLRERALRKMAV